MICSVSCHLHRFLCLSTMFVSQFWSYMSEHGFKQGRHEQRGVGVMQHEPVCRITCAGRSLQQRGERRGGGEPNRSSEEGLSLSFTSLRGRAVRPSSWGERWTVCVVQPQRAEGPLQGLGLLLSPNPKLCAGPSRPVPSACRLRETPRGEGGGKYSQGDLQQPMNVRPCKFV